MASDHSGTPWAAGVAVLDDEEVFAVASAGNTREIITVCGPVNSSDMHESYANARRIMGCVNALDGVPQQLLESGWSFVASQAQADRERLEAILNISCSEPAYLYSDRERHAYLAGQQITREAAVAILVGLSQQSALPLFHITKGNHWNERSALFNRGRRQGHTESADAQEIIGYLTQSGAVKQCTAETASIYGWKAISYTNVEPVQVGTNEKKSDAVQMQIEKHWQEGNTEIIQFLLPAD